MWKFEQWKFRFKKYNARWVFRNDHAKNLSVAPSLLKIFNESLVLPIWILALLYRVQK